MQHNYKYYAKIKKAVFMINNRIISLVIIIILLQGCSPKISEIINNIPEAHSTSYGYKPYNAIRIGYYDDIGKNIDAIDYYLKHLKTKSGKHLIVVEQVALEDPINKVEKSSLPLRFESNITSGILDLMVSVVEGTQDTVLLYFDTFHFDTLKTPQNLYFNNQIK